MSDETGIETFNLYNLFSGGAVHALGEAIDHNGDAFSPVSTQPVLSYRTDDFIRHFRIPVPNHIKIDVDGTELAILKGMNETLDHESLRSIMFELNEGRGHRDEIMEFLSNKGFRVDAKHGINHIFVRTA